MKNYFLLLTLFLLPITLLSQDQSILDKYVEKVNENKTLKDSISILIIDYKKKKDGYDSTILNLKTEKETLEDALKNVKDLKERKALTDRVTLLESEKKNLKDSIIILNSLHTTALNSSDQKYSSLQKEIDRLKNDEKITSTSRRKTLIHLQEIYNQDEKLIFKQDIKSFKSDLAICNMLFPEEKELNKSINKCIKIKESETLLSNKFGKIEIDKNINELKKLLPQTPLLTELIKDLTDYESKNGSVKKLINQLEIINKVKVIGTDRVLIEDKQKEVFTTIYFEIAYAPVDLNRYTYLRDIIEKIQDAKRLNIDASLSGVLNDL